MENQVRSGNYLRSGPFRSDPVITRTDMLMYCRVPLVQKVHWQIRPCVFDVCLGNLFLCQGIINNIDGKILSKDHPYISKKHEWWKRHMSNIFMIFRMSSCFHCDARAVINTHRSVNSIIKIKKTQKNMKSRELQTLAQVTSSSFLRRWSSS